jgi:hypothetical protein
MFTEERQFSLRFSVEARFEDDDDSGDDDHVWADEWERAVKPRVLRAVFDALRATPGWEAHARNRGVAIEDEVEIVVTRLPRKP